MKSTHNYRNITTQLALGTHNLSSQQKLIIQQPQTPTFSRIMNRHQRTNMQPFITKGTKVKNDAKIHQKIKYMKTDTTKNTEVW